MLEDSEAAVQAGKAAIEKAESAHELMAKEAQDNCDKWKSLSERMQASDGRMEALFARMEATCTKRLDQGNAELDAAWEAVLQREYELSAREAALEPATPIYGFVPPPRPPL